MIFTNEIYNLLIHYTKDSENIDITLEQLYGFDWYRCVWGHWKAKAYYNIDNYYQRKEDVPEGLQYYIVMTETEWTRYSYTDDRLDVQVIDKATCEKVYGKRI